MKNSRVPVVVELEVESIGFEGVSVARLDGVVHFVNGALPGETVRAQVRGKKKKFVETKLLEVLTPSPRRIQAPCPHFGVCGGCSWQHLQYEDQLFWKRKHVMDAFERIGHVEVGSYHDTIGVNDPFHYRNKMEFSFGASLWLTDEQIASGEKFDMSFALGLHVPGRFDKVLTISNCMLQKDVGNTVLAHTLRLSQQHGIRAYDQRAHEGFARHLVVRTSATTGSVMTVLVTASPSRDEESAFIEAWMQLFEELPAGSTMIHAVHDGRSQVATGSIQQIQGHGYLEETSHGITYRISPFSFFQTNTDQLPQLVGEAMQAAEITVNDVVWDLYCGTGTLTLPAAKLAKHVVGAELAQSSIDDATANAARNGIENISLHAIDLHGQKAIDLLATFPSPDVILVDPPRAGMHPMLVDHLRTVRAPRIVYVSCNPATQARDCALLADLYTVDFVTPVDMFPQTYHVESVARLTARSQ
ncbi:MAG: 23S rRNA (uracil(1939)-C(5))-methyltransferase RlmD [Bacteroidetes bacterium]|nr:23S rRNA (uracil(1939)-C(5))-methyltransferase RlmD [Bacteroidota bacterium]